MPGRRNIAVDATFMIGYIGFSAAMVALSVTLVTLLALDAGFGPLHMGAAAVNLLGWSFLPFAPRLYRSLTGERFSWHASGAFGGEIA